jgi:sporulation protein YlmC with PRC-barrel domain
MIKHTLTAAALVAVLATPAFAQTTKTDMSTGNAAATQNLNKQPGFVQQQDATEWRGSKLIGASVYGANNASIGDINDVLIAENGQIKAVVVGVGGFLGVGEKNVAVPFDALSIMRKADSSAIEKITVSYTKDQLKDAPKFAYYAANKSQTTGSGMSDSTVTKTPSTMPLNSNTHPTKAK